MELKDLIRAEIDADRFPELLELVYSVANDKYEEHSKTVTAAYVANGWGELSRELREMNTYLLMVSAHNYPAKEAKKWRTRRDQTDAERDEVSRQERIATAERELEYAKKL